MNWQVKYEVSMGRKKKPGLLRTFWSFFAQPSPSSSYVAVYSHGERLLLPLCSRYHVFPLRASNDLVMDNPGGSTDGSIRPGDFPPMSSSTDFAALEPAIVSACVQHERENENDRKYRCCLPFGEYFVKFGAYSSFYPEIVMLNYLADLAKSDVSAPRVPQVHHFFHDNGRMAYVVMEYIDLVQISAESLAPKAAQAVRWMRSVPAPHDVVLLRPRTQGQWSCPPRGFQEVRGASGLCQPRCSGALPQQGLSA